MLMKKTCRKSGKVKFKTHEKALHRGGEIITGKRNFTNIRHFRAYLCDFCNFWHLTKKI